MTASPLPGGGTAPPLPGGGPAPRPPEPPAPAAPAREPAGHAQPAKQRRPATLREMRALASPIRLRILRLTLDEEHTNKEIADLLNIAPATALHHVRTLVGAGLLAPRPVRRGARGSVERPYRATKVSWELDFTEVDPAGLVRGAMVEAFLAELAEVPPGSDTEMSRLGLRLPASRKREFTERVCALLEELAGLPPDPGGEAFAVFFAVYPRGPRS